MKSIRWLMVAAALVGVCRIGVAQPVALCPFDESPVGKSDADLRRLLVKLAPSACAGNLQSDARSELVTGVYADAKEGAEAGPKDPIKLRDGLVAAMRRLMLRAQLWQARAVDATDWRAIEDSVRRSETVVAAHKGGDSEQARETLNAAIPSTWAGFAAGIAERPLNLGPVVVQPFTGVTCPAAANNCPAFESRVDMLRVAQLMAQLQKRAQGPALDKQLEVAHRELRRWESYRSAGQHQYIWELMVNSALMRKRHCTSKVDAAGDRVYIGFCEVPTSQLILGHIDAGLRWSRSATKTSELKPVVLIETIGWYRWKWKSDSGEDAAVMVDRQGISLAAAYSRRDDGSKSRWSYGPMFHLGDYNLALTKARGERWGLMVNVQLADRYFGRRNEWYDKIKALH